MNIIVEDDLKFDGKNIIIPGYWRGMLLDIVKNIDESKIKGWNEGDIKDFLHYKKFIQRLTDWEEDIASIKAEKNL